MELRKYLEILLRRKWVILITMVVTMIVVIAGTFMVTPTYSARATLRIATSAAGTVNASDYMYAERLLNTYVQIATTTPVLDELNQRLGLADTPEVTVKTLPGTELIQIYAQHQDPYMAANIANTLAEILETDLTGASRTRSLYIVEPAVASLTPAKPNKILNVGLGIIIGLLGGFGLAFLFENLDSTLYTTEQIEELTKLPSLGIIPGTRIQQRDISTNGRSPYAEGYRRVRTNILGLDSDKALCSLLITSPRPGEGKSTIVSDLGSAFVQLRYKVIIVDCDLRLPTQHKIFNLPNEIGLSNVLFKNNDLEQAIQECRVPGLKVLTSGPTPEYPAELLSLSEMSEVIQNLQKKFDIILVDSPALLEVSDTAVIAPYMDGVVMVVSRASSRREDVLAACRQLEDNKAKVIGFIVNRSEQDRGYYYNKRKTIPMK